jgi:hypothetical protein
MSIRRVVPALALAAALAAGVAPRAGAARFTAAAGDTVPPPPADTSFITRIVVSGVATPTPTAGESIRVTIHGVFPSDCYRVRRIDAVPLHCGGSPCVPEVRLLVDDGGCLGRPCVMDSVPFKAGITLGPLPAGDYVLGVSQFVASCTDSFPDRPTGRHLVFFAVSSVPVPPCILHSWNTRYAECDAFVSETRPATLTLRAGAPVPLSGLQGLLHLFPDSLLRVTALEAVGPAAGMNLSWVQTREGARFVMFASAGAPIPPIDPASDPPYAPVLRVTVSTRPGASPPPLTVLGAGALLGADSLGNGVIECPYVRLRGANLCADRPCDANADGRTDVRDLVVMARCLWLACPDSLRFDCDRDGGFALDDIMCCARVLLGNATSTGEPRPSRAGLSLDGVRATPEGWEFDVRLSGALDVAAADVGIRFPTDRMEVTGTRLDPGVPGWLALHETRDGEVRLGLVRLAPDEEGGPDEVMVTVRVGLRPGAAAGGEVTLSSSMLAAPDGASIAASSTTGAYPFVAPPATTLSAAQPNPFAGETRFVASLARPGNAEVAVFDLAGRRIASIHRGRLAAGEHTFTWSGVTERGGRARDGVYFVRLDVDGERSTRKVVLRARP